MRVAYAFDENFAFPALVSLHSLLRHCSSAELEVLILDCGIGQESRKKLAAVADLKGVPLRFIVAKAEDLKGFASDAGHFSSASNANFARFLLPKILSHGSVIYLDADTLLLSDITELWDFCEARPEPILASRDYFNIFLNAFVNADLFLTSQRFRMLERLKISDETPYYNSGVLFLRSEPLLALGIEEGARALNAAEPGLRNLPDQNILNVLLKGRVGEFGFAWNYQIQEARLLEGPWEYPGVIDYKKITPKLLHYVSGQKPWLGLGYPAMLKIFADEAALLERDLVNLR